MGIGVTSFTAAKQMKNLHDFYWASRVTSYIGLTFPEASVYEYEIEGAPQKPMAIDTGGRLMIINGRLVIRKRK
jgi:hypothetical protein